MNIKKITNTVLQFSINRMIEILGIFVAIIGILLLIALVSYSPNDPNFIFPQNTQISNVLGFQGSYISDLFLQSIGIISYLLSVTLVITGINVFRGKDLFLIIENIFYSILYCIFGSLFFDYFYQDTFELYINGNGGFVGQYLGQSFFGNIINLQASFLYYFLIILISGLFLISVNFNLQFSWIIFFSLLFPFGALLALVATNVCVRSSLLRITKLLRRPIPRVVAGIGEFASLFLPIVVKIAIFMNLFVVVFTLEGLEAFKNTIKITDLLVFDPTTRNSTASAESDELCGIVPVQNMFPPTAQYTIPFNQRFFSMVMLLIGIWQVLNVVLQWIALFFRGTNVVTRKQMAQRKYLVQRVMHDRGVWQPQGQAGLEPLLHQDS